MDMLKYEDPYRPVLEWRSVVAWCGAGVLTLIVMALTPFQSKIFIGYSCLCFAMAAYRLLSAMHILHNHMALKGSGLSFMTRDELKAKCDAMPGYLYLGEGFDWTQEHTQMAYTIGRKDPSKVVPISEDDMGQRWLHGIGVANEKSLYKPVAHAGTHTLIVGTTGAGKTRTFDILLAQYIRMGYSVIIVDPKGDVDMADAARIACEEAGRPHDFIYFNPARPEISNRLDLLKNFARTTELATRIASLIASENANDPFASFSMMAVNKLCEALIFINDRPSLVLLRRLLEGGITGVTKQVLITHFDRVMPDKDAAGNDIAGGWRSKSAGYSAKGKGGDEALIAAYIQFYRDHVMQEHSNSTVEGLINVFEHDASHFGKMVTSLMPILTMLTSGPMAGLLSPDYEDPFDPRPITDLGKITSFGQVAYLALDSLSDSMVASAIGSLALADATAVAGARYNFSDDVGAEKPVVLFVDEVNEVINQPLIQVLNKGRGSKMSVYMATQTVADIESRLGSKPMTQKVLGNVNNVFVLRCNDNATQEYVSEMLPEVTVRTIQVGQSTKNEVDRPLVFSGTVSESLSEEQVPMVQPQLLSCIPNLEGFSRVSGGRVIKWRVPILVSKPPKAA